MTAVEHDFAEGVGVGGLDTAVRQVGRRLVAPIVVPVGRDAEVIDHREGAHPAAARRATGPLHYGLADTTHPVILEIGIGIRRNRCVGCRGRIAEGRGQRAVTNAINQGCSGK